MAFPKKFKHLLELKPDDVDLLDEAWLTYAGCGCEAESCGWQGWIIESVSRNGKQLPADTHQICPDCRRQLFRTEVTLRVIPSDDQSKARLPGRDYGVVPMEYK